jgi:membrane-bound lytic murein transglycosylase D
MSSRPTDPNNPKSGKSSRAVVARVLRGEAAQREARFTATFSVGRSVDCGVRFTDPTVAPRHFQVMFDNILWWVRDLNSPTGTFVDGTRIKMLPLSDRMEVELGKGGPALSLTITKEAQVGTEAAPLPGSKEGFSSEVEIIKRYLRPLGDKPAGKQTMMFRRAFDMAQKKSSRRYQVIIGLVLLVLLGAGTVIAYQAKKLKTLRSTAERLFYTAKSVDLQNAKLEELVLLGADPKQVAELKNSRLKLQQMEKEYDAFVQELGIYSKATEPEKAILRVARIFGECEVNVPKPFIDEVLRYVKLWGASDRLEKALQRAKQNGYGPVIAREFISHNLPPQYIYLALQESGFNANAVGPPTRYGHAKGMWQFISLTGNRYNLKIGPLFDRPVYDPRDDRFDWQKATVAAANYIKDLTVTDAQGSGLLAMACYNWGEDNVRATIQKLPENPRDRNFWRLLIDKRVPDETYNYVLSIFSVAVICENPRLFGFNVECPLDRVSRVN